MLSEEQSNFQLGYRIVLRRELVDAAIYCAIPIFVYFLVLRIFREFDAHNAYAIISLWWSAIYVAGLLAMRLWSLVFIVPFLSVFLVTVLVLQPELLYHDPPFEFDPLFLSEQVVGRILFFL